MTDCVKFNHQTVCFDWEVAAEDPTANSDDSDGLNPLLSSCSFPLLSGTRWLQKPKISSIRCWPSIRPNVSQQLRHSNTPGSLWDSRLLTQCSQWWWWWRRWWSCVVFYPSIGPPWHPACTGRKQSNVWRSSTPGGNLRWAQGRRDSLKGPKSEVTDLNLAY